MADSVPTFSAEANLARINAGFKGNPLFSDPTMPPEMSIGESYPAGVAEKLMSGPIDQPAVQDPWVARYPGAKL